MSAPRKRWDDHSARWKRERTREGLSKARWDAWFKLSIRSRKVADPYRYARGESVAFQRRFAAEEKALANMKHHFPLGRESTMVLGVQSMTAAQLKWTATASGMAMRKRAKAKPMGGERNPWWYR